MSTQAPPPLTPATPLHPPLTYGAHKLGSGVGATIVRDPVVTLVSLPRFLAPGDSARIGVVVNNLEGEAGDYRLTLSASGAGASPT